MATDVHIEDMHKISKPLEIIANTLKSIDAEITALRRMMKEFLENKEEIEKLKEDNHGL